VIRRETGTCRFQPIEFPFRNALWKIHRAPENVQKRFQVRRELLDAWPAGTRTIEFDGRDDNGRGVYFCRVTANGSSAVLKLMIVR